MSDYLDQLEAEILDKMRENGIVQAVEEKPVLIDNDTKVIMEMESLLGVKYSDEQKDILRHKGNACILACAGSGKALLNSTKVLTVFGYKEISTLKVNDELFDESGRVQYVKGVYPQGNKTVYMVTFSDGSVIPCCIDHLWGVYIGKKAFREGELEVHTTRELMKLYKEKRKLYLPKQTKHIELYGEVITKILLEKRVCIKSIQKELEDIIGNTGFNYDAYELLGEVIEYIGKRTLKLSRNVGEVFKIVSEFMGLDATLTVIDDNHCEFNVNSRKYTRYITKITKTNTDAYMTCIEVTGESKLYLTEHCIPTHNTTVSTHLIAKRIKTGEIKNISKLIYTTYSKKGQEEMDLRLKKVLNKLGYKYDIQVRTLHSFFLQILRMFGVSSNIISETNRLKLIREACADAGYTTKDDDLSIINNLLSYQVNNLMSDKTVVNCPMNTLDELKIEQYSAIRSGYAAKKRKFEGKFVIDYDDMQMYLYLWLCKYEKSSNPEEVQMSLSVRNYCQSLWTDFYVDEAQDVSKIQFEILKAMMTRPEEPDKLVTNLVFIGDDDQCLVGDTLITMADGYEKYISDVKIGDRVKSYGNGEIVESTVIQNIEHKYSKEMPLIEVTTESGKQIYGTPEHKAMVKLPKDLGNSVIEVNGNKWWLGNECQDIDKIKGTIKSGHGDKVLSILGLSEKLPHIGVNARKENGYIVTTMSSIAPGMSVQIKTVFNIHDEKVTKVKWIQNSIDKVYDLNLDKHHNFYANGMLVHNCIYQWRGSDPSIILSIGPLFNMPTFVLSTNYRCKSSIVDYATTGIKCNNRRYAKGMTAFTKGGSVKILQSEVEDLCNLSILAMKHIKYWLANGEDTKNIAVLGRNNFYLAILGNMLLREGIYCETTDDMKLTKSYMYKDFKNLMELSDICFNHNALKSVLWKLCGYMRIADANAIANFQDASALSVEQTLGYILGRILNKIEFKDKININEQAREKIKYFINRLSITTIDDILRIYNIISSKDTREAKFKSLILTYTQVTSYMYKTKELRRSIEGLSLYFINLVKKDGYDGLKEFLRITEQYETGNMGVLGNKLTLSTIHSAKGREWKNVIMFACDNLSTPNLDAIAQMADEGISESDIYEKIDEERRLFYVGNTRAKENLLVITYKVPSVFIMEALGMFGNVGNNSRILSYAKDNIWINAYKDDIQEMLQDKNSDYYYDKDLITGEV